MTYTRTLRTVLLAASIGFGLQHTVSSSLGFQYTTTNDNPDTSEFVQTLETTLPNLMEEYLVPGVAVAIIQNGQVIYSKGYGYSDAGKSKPINNQTGFNVGSISKTVAAWGVMQLVEEGLLSLDTPIEEYLNRWHLPKSEFNTKGVTVRRLLSHTAGLPSRYYPGWEIEEERPSLEDSLSGKYSRSGGVRLIMEPGTKYKYSGGGYTLSQLLIEEVTGQSFEDYMHKKILVPLGMNRSNYTLTSKILAGSSVAHDQWGLPTYTPRFTAKAAAGLHTTIEDLARFAVAAMQGPNNELPGRQVLKPTTVSTILTPVSASNGAFGLGYTVNKLTDGSVSHGHRGANRGWHAYFNIIPESGNGIVVTTNGTNGSFVDSQILCKWTKWVTQDKSSEGCKQVKPVSITMFKTINESGVEAAISQYHQLKKDYSEEYAFDESQLNTLGYGLLGQRRNDDATKILQLNTIIFPTSVNAFDSLAESYMYSGKKLLAIEKYKHVLLLDPLNAQAKNMIEKLSKSE